MTGTLVNTAAIIAGSIIGVLIHSRLNKRTVDMVYQGLGLFALALGISMSLRSDNFIITVISIVTGGVIGQWLGIERALNRFSKFLERKTNSLTRNGGIARRPARSQGNFSEGFITATMLFCVGSMSILGALEEGTGQVPTLFLTKSIMDGVSSVVLAASFGIAVIYSCIPVFIYQGGLTLFAAFITRFMSEAMIDGMTAVGGILLIGIGINVLKIKNLSVINMLPALLIVVVLTYFWP